MRTLGFAVTFLLIGAIVGFTFGTAVLVGPVRWVAAAFRTRGGTETWENAAVLSVIAIVVAMVVILALFLTQTVLTTPSKKVRFGIPLAVLAAGLVTNFYWQKSTLQSMRRTEERVARFTFGPYPDEARMERLRREGYTAVVSLLHPAVLPFEPRLIARERASAAKAGLPVIELPMLPWVSRNEKSLARLRELAAQKDGRYYVHCHLGVDRVMIARRVVEAVSPNVAAVQLSKGTGIGSVKRFERGDIVRLDAATFVTPFPTQEEFVTHILSEPAISIFCILDPKEAEDAVRIAEERRILEPYRIPLEVTPLSPENYDPNALLRLVERVKSTSGRRLVHAFLGATTGKSPVAEAFIRAYATNRPPILPSLDGWRLRDGIIRLAGPDVAEGPLPFGGEVLHLQRHGVRQIICVEHAAARCRPEDVYQPPGIGFAVARDAVEAGILLRSTKGPHYLYMPQRPSLDEPTAAHIGPLAKGTAGP